MRPTAAIAVLYFCLLAVPRPATAESLEGALAAAYRNNPSLNAQRANARATDENVPQALSGYRPKISVTATTGPQYLSTTSKLDTPPGYPAQYITQSGSNVPVSVGLTMTQTLFNGFQTANRTRAAEAQVLSARANLAAAEANVLLNGATAYMDVLRDSANRDLQRRNVEVLEEQLRQTRDRFGVGEVTRTDVAQAETQLASGRSQLLNAEAKLQASMATYRQIIGEAPDRLSAASPVDRFGPSALKNAIALAVASNPLVAAAQYNVDVAQSQVKIAEGALLPTLAVQGSLQQSSMAIGAVTVTGTTNASLLGSLTVPLYQGGAEYSLIRQAKETLGQTRLQLDVVRDQVRQAAVQAWGAVQAAKGQIESTQAEVKAAELALNGVREEARVGQRTTLDVLNAQQSLVNARVALVTAQHDRVVASYDLLATVGRLRPDVLGLHAPLYRPQTHYEQVRDAWAGTRTPSGR
jgi:outer membrane protein